MSRCTEFAGFSPLSLTCCFVFLLVGSQETGAAGSFEQIDLSKSITTIPNVQDTDLLVLKTWEDNHDANSHFDINLYLRLESPLALQGFYQRIPVLSGQKEVTLKAWEGADCSISQSFVFLRKTTSNNDIIVATADRVEEPDGIPVQSEPRPQDFRMFITKHNHSGSPGRSSVWLERVAEIRTSLSYCSAEEIGETIKKYVEYR